MVNNIDNNPNVFSQITGENNGKYVAYSYLNQDGTDPNANGSCCCSWWCSDFASKLAQGFGGIGAAYVTAKYGNPKGNNGNPKGNNGNKPPATTPPTGGGTTTPAPPMSLGKKVLIGGGIVGGLAVIITIIVVARKNK